MNLDLNLATGEGNGYGEAYFYPEDSEEGNYFVGWWHGAFYSVDGVWILPKSHSNTDGVGDLEGWRTKSKSYLLDPSEYAGYCSGRDPFGVQISRSGLQETEITSVMPAEVRQQAACAQIF